MNAAKETNNRYWWVVVLMFFIGWIFMYADRTILGPIMTEIQKEYGLTKAQLGLISSLFFLSYAALQIPSGVMGDKIGRKIVLVPGYIFFGLMTIVSGLTKSWPAFLAARIMTGVGEGTYYGPQYALSSEAIPQKKRSVGSAVINSGMAFGTSAGLILSSYLVFTRGMNWRVPFYVMGALTIVAGLLIWFFVREHHSKASKAEKAAASQERIPLKRMFNRTLIMTYIMVFCSLYGNFMILTWVPYYLQTSLGIKGSEVGWVSSLIPWASIPAAVLFSYLSDRAGRRKPFVYLLVPLAALSILAIASTQNLTLVYFAMIAYGFTGKLALDPILVAFVADNAPKKAYSTVFGLYNFVGMSSSILAPYITGAIADRTGTLTSGFIVAVVLLFIGLVAMFFAKEESRVKVAEQELATA